jgi:predicted dehydrogenase
LLAEARPDVVSICTPDETHADLVAAALVAPGVRGVLAEKPLATDLANAEGLVQLARVQGVVLAVNYSRRYAPPLARLAAAVRGGEFGNARLLRGVYGKGTLHNGSHWFDLARFLAGEVVAVRADDRLHEGGPDPSLDVRLTFASGAVGDLIAWPANEYSAFELDLLGSRGRARLTALGNVLEIERVVEGVPSPGFRGLVLAGREEGCLRDVLLHAVADLAAAIASGGETRSSGPDAVAAVRIAHAARGSAASGQEVVL